MLRVLLLAATALAAPREQICGYDVSTEQQWRLRLGDTAEIRTDTTVLWLICPCWDWGD